MARSARQGRQAENAVFGQKFKTRRCRGGMRARDEAYCMWARVRLDKPQHYSAEVRCERARRN
jgi:hypothetical protein